DLRSVGAPALRVALADPSCVFDALESTILDVGDPKRCNLDRALEEVIRGASADEVRARFDEERPPESGGSDLTDDGSARVVAKHDVAAVAWKHERAGAFDAEPGQRDPSLPAEVELEMRMLRAVLGATRRADRRRVGVVVRFADGDDAITVRIGGAAQARDEVMREERAADLVGFLGLFVRGAGRHEHHAFARELLVEAEGERRDAARSFGPRQRARAARVEDQQTKRRRGPAHEATHAVEVEP